jgi:hypothetical protein
MKSLIGVIALAIMILMLLPANNVSSQTSPPDSKLYPIQKPFGMVAIAGTATQSQSELCPAVLELPLMLGRPAPCLRNYRLH